jgi:hypothetical protein
MATNCEYQCSDITKAYVNPEYLNTVLIKNMQLLKHDSQYEICAGVEFYLEAGVAQSV